MLVGGNCRVCFEEDDTSRPTGLHALERTGASECFGVGSFFENEEKDRFHQNIVVKGCSARGCRGRDRRFRPDPGITCCTSS